MTKKDLIYLFIKLDVLLDLFMLNNINIKLTIEQLKNLLIEYNLDNNLLDKPTLEDINNISRLDKKELKELILKNLNNLLRGL